MRAYQIHLVATGTSWAGFNVAVSALRFFYGVTLGRSAMVERIPYARKQRQLPVILSAEEAWELMATTGLQLASAGFDVRVPELSRRRRAPSLRIYVEGSSESSV